MPDDLNEATTKQHSTLVIPLLITLATAIICFTCIAMGKRTSNNVVTGNLQVTFDLITAQSEISQQTTGGRDVDASRIEYYPNYVLVTTTNGVTHLWRIERLNTFEVSHTKSAGNN